MKNIQIYILTWGLLVLLVAPVYADGFYSSSVYGSASNPYPTATQRQGGAALSEPLATSPHYIAAPSGDLHPFGVGTPLRGGRPGTGGQDPENTDIEHEEEPLSDGIFFLLLLSILFFLEKTRKELHD